MIEKNLLVFGENPPSNFGETQFLLLFLVDLIHLVSNAGIILYKSKRIIELMIEEIQPVALKKVQFQNQHLKKKTFSKILAFLAAKFEKN